MDTLEQNPVHKDDSAPEALEPSPIKEEYAPVIFAQDIISHVVSIDLLSGTVSFFSIFCIFSSHYLLAIDQIELLNWSSNHLHWNRIWLWLRKLF